MPSTRLSTFALALVVSGKLLESNALAINRDHSIGFSFNAYHKPTNDASSTNMTFGTLISVTSESDLEYLGKVNVGGQGKWCILSGATFTDIFDLDFNLVIDTGSSDLWVTGQQIKIDKNTSDKLNLTYGIGSASGNIAYTTVRLGTYEVQNQAFLNVDTTYQQAAQGILGLGFISLSGIEKKVNNKAARPIMASIFEQNSSTPNFVALALERTTDQEDTSGGIITIGEYDPRFKNVAGTTKYPLAPATSSRWTIALSGMQVNGHSVTLKSAVKGTKKGTAISLIDSGTSLAYIPSDAVDAIYGAISGSVHIKTNGQNFWITPCLGQANVSFSFGNDHFPINPLELTRPATFTDGGNQYTVCVSAFRPQLSSTDSDMDFLLGDIFMRNVYSVFNFGNITSSSDDNKDASIQFLSRSNQDQVYQEFQQQRTQNLKNLPPLYDVSKIHSDGTSAGGGRINSR
ncbi:aspartic peptidase domain-containing protein [Suillus paluster]|uniref:aspartic peptidase domain-containing protein n=1 Tax=Suillus paluster TaxID=48578 RepID=UPI001B87432E|nr:aspartic peptidase domain-containing protein [Suillus paluster]KAG1749656.1 aspartic peptidase domain-containing protein [Suillus paluster]